MTSRFPTLGFPHLWHVGSFKAKAKGRDSYEGSGLSVSLHPGAWRRIAKLGGKCWLLQRDGNAFLDALALSEADLAEVRAWGIANNYVFTAQLFRLDYADQDENGEDVKRWSIFHTRRRADEEAAEYDDASVTEFEGLVGMAKLHKATRSRVDPDICEDLLLTLYGDLVLDLDGVWWAETLDPDNFSAPRGVIFPRKVPLWSRMPHPGPEEED